MKKTFLKLYLIFGAAEILIFLLIMTSFNTFNLNKKQDLAELTVKQIRNELLVKNYRDAIRELHILAQGNFLAISFNDVDQEEIFSISSDNADPTNFWINRKSFLIDIFFDPQNHTRAGTLNFSFDRNETILDVSLVWLAIFSISILLFSYIKRKIVLSYDNQRALMESEFRLNLAKKVAHDIRSPIVTLRTAVKLGGTDIPAKTRSFINMSIQRIGSIANDLLDECSSSIAPVKINLICQDIFEEKQVEFKEKYQELALDLKLKLSNGDLVSSLDRSRLERTLSNLLNNAAEAVSSPALIKLETKTTGEWNMIIVSDNGKGMSPEELIQIQTPYTSLKDGGHGIGLSSAREFVERLGGDLKIESTLGAGTSVTIYLKAV